MDWGVLRYSAVSTTLGLNVSMFSFVLLNACSPYITNVSFVFRQEKKSPNVLAIVPTCLVSYLNRLGTKTSGLLSVNTTQDESVVPTKRPQQSLSESDQAHFLGSRGLSTTLPSLSEPRDRRATIWMLLEYVREGCAAGDSWVINALAWKWHPTILLTIH